MCNDDASALQEEEEDEAHLEKRGQAEAVALLSGVVDVVAHRKRDLES